MFRFENLFALEKLSITKRKEKSNYSSIFIDQPKVGLHSLHEEVIGESN